MKEDVELGMPHENMLSHPPTATQATAAPGAGNSCTSVDAGGHAPVSQYMCTLIN